MLDRNIRNGNKLEINETIAVVEPSIWLADLARTAYKKNGRRPPTVARSKYFYNHPQTLGTRKLIVTP